MLTSSLVVAFVACATPSTFEEEDSGTADAGRSDAAGGCPAAQMKCATACTDTSKDLANCGACAVKCKATQYCVKGKCNDACSAPAILCGQFCVDTTTDHENCGACGKGCANDQVCINKACAKSCPPALTVCDMDCVDTTSDPNNCGACANACGMNENCTGSTCCPAGSVTCNGACTDLKFDYSNCGACGFACGGNTPYCSNGQCVAGCVPSGNRLAFNNMNSHTANGCWMGNPCGTNAYNFSQSNGINFQANGQDLVCGGTTGCVAHVGITTYASSNTICQGKFDVYCDSNKVATLDTVGKTCGATAMTNGCNAQFVPQPCSTIRLVATGGSGQQSCCGGNAPDIMVVGVSAW